MVKYEDFLLFKTSQEMSPIWANIIRNVSNIGRKAHVGDISYNVFTILFCHSLSEAIPSQGKPDLNNTLINSRYLDKFVCQVLVLQNVVQGMLICRTNGWIF